MNVSKKMLDDLTYEVIGCAIEVHKQIGPGLLESVYERGFLRELEIRGIPYRNQITVPLHYKGLSLDAEIRLDVLVEDLLCVELKAQEGVLPVHEAILLSYMQMLEKPKGLMLNFHCKNIFREGQKTYVNQFNALLPDK